MPPSRKRIVRVRSLHAPFKTLAAFLILEYPPPHKECGGYSMTGLAGITPSVFRWSVNCFKGGGSPKVQAK